MKSRLFICLLFSIILGSGCTPDRSPQTSNSKSAPQNYGGSIGRSSKLSYKITKATEKTFGYDIYLQNKILIQQKNVPCMAGNLGFATRTDAEKVARLVMNKVRQGKMPPTITIEEMRNLNVIK